MLSSSDLRVELRRAGIANSAVDAVWPQWWSSEAEGSLSATAELTFTVARRLGLVPRTLLDGEAEFTWRDETKYKRLTSQATGEEAALSAFGFAVTRALLRGVPGGQPERYSAAAIRESILASAPAVDAESLLVLAWALGIPVIHLRVFPLPQKRMNAMSVGLDQRAAILLARDEAYAAPMAFTLAHELGHIMLGHLDGGSLIDFDLPLRAPISDDDEENQSDQFALELLTGQADPVVMSDQENFSASQLAEAAMTQGKRLGIEPGILAMCAGHTTKRWDRAYGALKIIPPGRQDVATRVNEFARNEVGWDQLAADGQDYLQAVMGLGHSGV